MAELPAMQLFRDVPVVPVPRARGMVAMGGPIWPDFDTQVAARHCRDGAPCDRAPRRPARTRKLEEPAVWGGYLVRQFGHLISEHLTRLPQSLRDRPDDVYLFTVQHDDLFRALPGYIWELLDWYGVRRDQVRIVKRAWLVGELRVAAQGEMLGGIPTCTPFLELLEETARRNRLVPEPHDVVFVTRAGLVPAGRGGHAGEAYLCALLEAQGVKVVDPGKLSVQRQMELYAGAKALVFAEGSALHGRCVLGRIEQEIHVLRRRSMRNTARSLLSPRCSQLVYHQVLAGRLGTETDRRGSRQDLEVALYDPEVLFAVFAQLGIDLRPVWQDEAYRAAVRSDLAAWVARIPTSAKQRGENLAMLADLGFASDFLPESPAPIPATMPDLKGQTDGPVHPAEEFEDPHWQDLAEARGQERAEVPDLPLEP
ncbi:MAG: glycosyltransferase family 61 protein [Tabrizicola sp.]|jgi:hypothetical protein|nr:glycosyltransferase family 61 protein [Tabrizicola sp.]